jgi:hypothetical protein
VVEEEQENSTSYKNTTPNEVIMYSSVGDLAL